MASVEQSRPGPVRRAPGGFTLLEVLIALTLTVAVGAVVLPAAMSWVGAAGLDEVAGRLESALALARADAQRRGEVLEVVAVTGVDGVTELRSRRLAAESEERAATPESQEAGEVSPETPGEQPAEETVLAELVRGIVLRHVTEGQEETAASAELGTTDRAAQAMVLALALPDGRVVAENPAAELRAVGGDGRWVVLRINGWTGGVESRAGVAAGEQGSDEPREDPAEAP